MRIKITLITIFTALFFITGCASIEPFPQNTSLGKSDASRITIESKMEAQFNFNDNVPYGKLFLNSFKLIILIKSLSINFIILSKKLL